MLLSIASEMPPEEIEKRSRVQRRGRLSTPNEADIVKESEMQECATCVSEQTTQMVASSSSIPPQIKM